MAKKEKASKKSFINPNPVAVSILVPEGTCQIRPHAEVGTRKESKGACYVLKCVADDVQHALDNKQIVELPKKKKKVVKKEEEVEEPTDNNDKDKDNK